jgi:hypothetical protein
VPEVPHAGEDHGGAGAVDGVDDLLVADAAARLHEGGDAVAQGLFDAVGEGEERVGGERGALRALARLGAGDAHALDARHLPGADAEGGAGAGEDDGVRLDVFADAPGEVEIVQLGLGGGALADDAPRAVLAARRGVALLHDEAARDALEVEPGRRTGVGGAGGEQAQVLLGPQDGERLVVEGGGDDALEKGLGERPGDGAGDGAVEGDDAAEGRDLVGGAGAPEGLFERGALRDAAGVRVLDDDGGGRVELARGGEGGLGVDEVVERELFAAGAEALGGGELARAGGPLAVEGGALVRVLAVAQAVRELVGERQVAGRAAGSPPSPRPER